MLKRLARTYVEGENYDVITPPVRTADPDKIEVAEFFWYGCGHCYTFEPMIAAWKKTFPKMLRFAGPRPCGTSYGAACAGFLYR